MWGASAAPEAKKGAFMGDFNSTLFRQLADAEESTMTRDETLEDTWTPAQLRSIEDFKKLIWKVLMLRASQMMKKNQDGLAEKKRYAETSIELRFETFSAASKDGDADEKHAKGGPSSALLDTGLPFKIMTENVRVGVKLNDFDYEEEKGEKIPQESVWWCAQLTIKPLVCPNPK
jgi:hypothetical protein